MEKEEAHKLVDWIPANAALDDLMSNFDHSNQEKRGNENEKSYHSHLVGEKAEKRAHHLADRL
jgi:hypothetical protein